MIKTFIYNALNSWVTTGAGAILGVPLMWEGFQGFMDDDPATGIVWKTLIAGVGILFAGMMTRDHTKAWTSPPKDK